MTLYKYAIIFSLISFCHAAEWFAPNVERSTFVFYIENYAHPGDVIYFPADTAVWNQPYMIKKGVILIGAGMDSTYIRSNYNSFDPLILFNPSNYELNAPFRFSGFTLDCGGKSRGIYLGHDNLFHPYKIQTKVRIDHNRFKGAKAGDISAQYIWHFSMFGVIDNNIFEPCYWPIKADPNSDCSWWEYVTYTPGAEDDCMYIEDNVFQGISGMVSDGQFSGRYVCRYNDIRITFDMEPMFDMHGNQSGTFGMCSTFGCEIYGNNITGNFDVRFVDQRGGQAFVYYNNKNSTNDYYEIQVREEYADAGNPPACAPDGQPQHVSDSYYWNNRINKRGELFSVTEAQHVGDIPLVNRDFFYDTRVNHKAFNGTSGVGCGCIADRPATCTTGVGYWATEQSVTDLTGKVGAHPDSVISGIFYKATAPNTWTEYYKPLPYPHPLRKPEPLKNLHFIK
ncbi:hypothetical protein EH223_15980 [candidate division KSB1 bacterium]|nr:hypothetical protein [candidate division KSB1 bacterium]RQW01194.1 MAG: hypothetical protein EH223_15980 [candidate division KSB1 bacterium]